MVDETRVNPLLNDENTMLDKDDRKSSRLVLDALFDAKKTFERWHAACNIIDEIYSHRRTLNLGYENYFHWRDGELDLFWSSFEIMKPAIYTRPPVPVVTSRFKDRDLVKDKTAELLERVASTTFCMSNINQVMELVRDDLLFTGRGSMWLTYENHERNGQCVHIEHLDRFDFIHEPTRKWCEVGWVARRAWMTQEELRDRFEPTSGNAWESVNITKGHNDRNDRYDFDSLYDKGKGGVWEVWHRSDNMVYWVSENVQVFLDSDKPHLDLCGFFPCPRPAYGTLARRSLIPIPDYERYSDHFNKINKLTARIYLLLDRVQMKGLIPAGGDVADAISEMIHSRDDELLIPVPQAAMMENGGQIVAWFPLQEITTAIQNLIQARSQLIDDFYQLSGISDIMRGATEAQETLGAQQLKGQYGSVRVRCKIDELQRVAADSIEIASEIISEKFSQDTLLAMSQMKISTRSEIDKQIKQLEKASKQELDSLQTETKKYLEENQIPDEAIEQVKTGFQEAQQKILQKYNTQIQQAQMSVSIDEIMKLLRDGNNRPFTFEIASDSTILTDEASEKQSRAEFLQTFAGASQTLQALVQTGESGAALAGGMLSFVLAPYRVGRELDSLIDSFIDDTKNMAAAPSQDSGEGAAQAQLAQAQNQLAEAEMAKAQAQMAKVQADAQLQQAEQQRKLGELNIRVQKEQMEAQIETEKLRAQNAKLQAEIEKLRAETAKTLAQIDIDYRKQFMDEQTTLSDDQRKNIETSLKVDAAANAVPANDIVIGV